MSKHFVNPNNNLLSKSLQLGKSKNDIPKESSKKESEEEDAKQIINNKKSQDESEEDDDENDYKIQIVKSSVFLSNKNECFDQSIWLYVTELAKVDKNSLKFFYPHGISNHGELVLIGKTRTRLSSSNRVTDQVGLAKKSNLKLQVCHANKIFELATFYALNFNKKDCFEWRLIDDTKKLNLFKYALRLGTDTLNQSCIFAGRTLESKYNTSLIGHINSSSNELTVIINNKELICLKQFEILCLKPSPAKLKHLCRNLIRSLMNNDNENINKLEYLMESSIIKYLKYKNCLKPGECLRRGECLQSKNGKYKLSLELDDRLLYYINSECDYMCLYKNVDSLWFNDVGGVIVCFKDFKTTSFVNNFNYLNIIYDEESTFKLNDDGNLHLTSSLHPKIIIIQFRDDIKLSINSSEPNFDYVFFFAKNSKHEMFRKNTDSYSSSSDDESSGEDSISDQSSGSELD